jgi:hypothetical protein
MPTCIKYYYPISPQIAIVIWPEAGQSPKKDFASGLTKNAVDELFFTGFPYMSQQSALGPRIGPE